MCGKRETIWPLFVSLVDFWQNLEKLIYLPEGMVRRARSNKIELDNQIIVERPSKKNYCIININVNIYTMVEN